MPILSRKACAVFTALALAAAAGARSRGQDPGAHSDRGAAPSFEVATIKPAPRDSAGTNFEIAPGRFSAQKATVIELIRFAYNVKINDGIEGAPKWADSEEFAVDAKIGDAEADAMQKLQPPQRLEQDRLMLQSLLAERLGLITNTQTRELPVYELVLAKNGPKLAAADLEKQHMPMLWGGSRGELHASSVSMALFADWISGNSETAGRSVIDQTGLKGSYDFTLKWTRIESGASAMGGPTPSQPVPGAITTDQGAPSLFTAIQEQLGLKLRPAKGPVKVVVIERLEKPSPN